MLIDSKYMRTEVCGYKLETLIGKVNYLLSLAASEKVAEIQLNITQFKKGDLEIFEQIFLEKGYSVNYKQENHEQFMVITW